MFTFIIKRKKKEGRRGKREGGRKRGRKEERRGGRDRGREKEREKNPVMFIEYIVYSHRRGSEGKEEGF